MISKKMQSLVANGSAIRAMFEEGKKMAAVYGAENVYDFSLGNPCTPPPESVRKAAVDILMKDEKFIQFDAYEKAIDEYFNQYQNRIINQIPPFDETIPTLENMSDYFVYDIRRIVEKLGGQLVKMESSETPTRSYVISFERDDEYLDSIARSSKEQMGKVVDELLDRILD